MKVKKSTKKSTKKSAKKSAKKRTRSASLTFNLPGDRDDLHLAQRGGDYFFALYDFARKLREGMKYMNKKWDDVSEVFYSVLEDYNIDIYGEVE